MSTEPNTEECQDKEKIQFEALMSKELRQLEPGTPWSPENEIARLKDIERRLEFLLRYHRALTVVAEDGCQKGCHACKKELLGVILTAAASNYRGLKSYAEYLFPGRIVDFPLSD